VVNGYPLPACPALTVRNLAASTLWYEAGLGFRLIFTNVDGADDPQVALAGGRGLGVTLRFSVSGSVDALAEKVKSYGIEILLGPVDRPWKAREFVVADPDGYHLAFTGRMADELPLEALAIELPIEEKAVVSAI
jgi:catechol 2,3-dioxygenase-like lactoylglutathione lyase family enzyme